MDLSTHIPWYIAWPVALLLIAIFVITSNWFRDKYRNWRDDREVRKAKERYNNASRHRY